MNLDAYLAAEHRRETLRILRDGTWREITHRFWTCKHGRLSLESCGPCGRSVTTKGA